MDMIEMFYITFPSSKVAKDLCDKLLLQKYIACYNLVPIEACYWWDGSVAHEEEIVAIAKSVQAKVTPITNWLEEHHPYDTPCIIHWGVNGNQKYVDWVRANVAL